MNAHIVKPSHYLADFFSQTIVTKNASAWALNARGSENWQISTEIAIYL